MVSAHTQYLHRTAISAHFHALQALPLLLQPPLECRGGLDCSCRCMVYGVCMGCVSCIVYNV
jgi:hypothetical protein